MKVFLYGYICICINFLGSMANTQNSSISTEVVSITAVSSSVVVSTTALSNSTENTLNISLSTNTTDDFTTEVTINTTVPVTQDDGSTNSVINSTVSSTNNTSELITTDATTNKDNTTDEENNATSTVMTITSDVLNVTLNVTVNNNGTTGGNNVELDASHLILTLIVITIVAVATVSVMLIIFVCVKKRSGSPKGVRYHVESCAEDMSVLQYDKNVQMDDTELQRKSIGNPNYQIIDEESFTKNRSENMKILENGDSKQKLSIKQSEDETGNTNTTESDIKRNVSNISIKSDNSSKSRQGDMNSNTVCNGEVDHEYSKPIKRGNTIQILDPASRNSNSRTRLIRKSNSLRHVTDDTLNKMGNELENDISTQLKVENYSNEIDDDDDVYLNASSGPIVTSTNGVSRVDKNEFVWSSGTVEDIYEFATPVNDDNVQENDTDKKMEQTGDDIEEDHYDLTEPEKCQKEDSTCCVKRKDELIDHDSEDVIYENNEDDDDVIYMNDDEVGDNKDPNEDTYDCALSSNGHSIDNDTDDTYYDSATNKTLQLGSSDNIYDFTGESNYDVTQHESQKRRFIVLSSDDNYDHCELPTEREDYDLVVLPEDDF